MSGETLRTEAYVLGTLLADNTFGAISPLDLRDSLYSIWHGYQLQLTAPAAEPANVAGTIYWFDGQLNICTGVDGVVGQPMTEQWTDLSRNDTGAPISNGQACYISGAVGSHTTAGLASNVDDTSQKTIGLATQDIAINASGYITIHGLVHDLDTSAWAEGTTLYLGATPGSLTSTKPSGAKRVVEIGVVTVQSATVGVICVMIHPRRPVAMLFGLTERTITAPAATYKALDLDVLSDTSRIFFDKALFPGTCEVFMLVKSTAGNPVSFQLWDETAGAAVVHDAITTSSTAFELKATGLLTLLAGLREYSIRAKYDAGADTPKLGYAVMSVR